MKRVINLTKKSNSLFGLSLIVFLFIGLGIFLLPEQLKQYPQYTAESPSPSGTKAFYTLLGNNYDNVEVWKKPAESLSPAPNQLMIMIEPNEIFSNYEEQRWIDWIEAGNTIWLIESNPEEFFYMETLFADNQPSEKTGDIVNLQNNNREYQGLIQTEQRLLPIRNDEILLKDNYGVIALSRKYGDGELMVLIAPDWLTNEKILEYNHIELILPFIERANAEKIWVNDYIHGYNTKLYLSDLYPKWLLFTAAQGIIILLLWLWYKGKRFGSVEVPREWVVRYGDERTHAIASWYLYCGFYKQSLLDQEEYLRYIVKEKWGIPFTMENNAWIEALKHYLPINKQQYWLMNLAEFRKILDKEKVTHKDYHKGSRILDDLRKEVENGYE